MLKLQLYSRPQCHLCEILMEEVGPLVDGVAEVELVDISGDPDLMRRYGLRIPVLSFGSEELSAFPLNADAVREFLATHVD